MSDDASAEVARIRGGGVGLFFTEDEPEGFGARGVIEVTGGDATRWLDGMVSNDVAALAPGSPRSGCYAALLSPKGKIVADVHVLAQEGGYWLESARHANAAIIARLDRYIIADDVKLDDRSTEFVRIGVEGAAASAVLTAAADGSMEDLARDSWQALEIGGVSVTAARYGWSGEDAYQLFAPAGSRRAVVEALQDAAGDVEVSPCSMAALEVLRIEAGVPLLGAELDEGVLPDEARLEAAISRTKGCYTGQEIVARVFSRGAVNHLLVGLAFERDTPPAIETELFAEGRKTGEITSACSSPSAGAIGLGYVRRDHAEPGTLLDAGGARARVVALPIVPPATPALAPG